MNEVLPSESYRSMVFKMDVIRDSLIMFDLIPPMAQGQSEAFPVMLPCFPTCQVLGFGLLVEWRLQQGGEGNSLWAQVSGPGISNFPWLQAEKAQGSEVKEEGEDPDKEKAPPDFFADGFCALTTAAQTVILDGINKIKDSPKFCYRKKWSLKCGTGFGGSWVPVRCLFSGPESVARNIGATYFSWPPCPHL